MMLLRTMRHEAARTRSVMWIVLCAALAADRIAAAGGSVQGGDTNHSIFIKGGEGISLAHLRCDGGKGAPPITLRQWRQIHHEATRGSSTDRCGESIRDLLCEIESHLERGVIPIAILSTVRSIDIRPDCRDDAPRGGRDLPPGGGTAMRTFAAAAVRDRTQRGERVVFTAGHPLIVGDGAADIRRIEVDFADGRGFRAIQAGEDVAVRYASTGRREIRVRADIADGSTLHAGFYFLVERLQTPVPHDTLEITSIIPYEGAYGGGSAYCYLADSHASLENPIIAVEGFDIDNTMNWDELYLHLNQESLLETLRSEGYDLVVLNFTDATDFIQKNSFVLVELIVQVQAAIDPERNLAVVGASMGGLVARYALAYMEAHGLEHRTVLLMTLDTPHRGANIPLGIQYWMDFFSEQSADAAFLLGQLDRPAARQMLVYHHTDPPGSAGEADPLRAILEADFAAVGQYPLLPRKVAIANGSGSGLDQGFEPGEQIILYEYSSLLVDIIGNVWAVPDGGTSIIFDGLLDLIWPLPDDEMSVTVSGTLPYDCAPGGTRASMAQMDTTEAPYGDIVALHDVHCFIPTVSALDFDTGDLYHDIAGDPDPVSQTPFDAIYYPIENQEHVAITPENAAWIIGEIRSTITAVDPGTAAPAPWLVLQQNYPNPFNPATSISFTLQRSCHVELAVFNVGGERIRTLLDRWFGAGRYAVRWDGRDERGHPAASGVYLCRMCAGGVNETRKMVLLR